jgi:hypothetical protein
MRVSEAMTPGVKICTPGDVARKDDHREVVAETVAGVSTPGGPHRQTPAQ